MKLGIHHPRKKEDERKLTCICTVGDLLHLKCHFTNLKTRFDYQDLYVAFATVTVR